MRLSQFFLPTEKEDRSEAVLVSHRLMIRAGMIRQLTSGVFSYLPLGRRSIRKVAHIVGEEVARAGAQEVSLPALQPADLWRESGRWDGFGPELVRLRDRNGRQLCLGPTHEEIITDLVRKEIRSYRQLPLKLYQIQTKFRDEQRPRYGVVRSREFTTEDAYSFDATEEGAQESYHKMYNAYTRIFQRCGLRFQAVEAESRPFEDSVGRAFMALADFGEDLCLICNRCDYAATVERAEIAPLIGNKPQEVPLPLEQVPTPEMRTVDEVCGFLQVGPSQLIKTLIYRADGEAVAVLVRGDREVNEAKVRRALGCTEIELADEDLIQLVTGAPMGFAGPVGLDRGPGGNRIPILADHEVQVTGNAVTGGNEADVHLIHVNTPRDFLVDRYGDFRIAVAGDRCPRCEDGTLVMRQGIEVGRMRKLGTRYSEAMGATFQDENADEHPLIMGRYTVGIERILAAAIEQNYDEEGIIFPMPIAPFQVIVLCIQPEKPGVAEVAESLYGELQNSGIETLLDDRPDRPGSKFKDADLIGIPLRVNVGARMLKEEKVELRHRATKEVEVLTVDHVGARVLEIIRDQTERDPGSYR